jgi:hypothetical protein
MPNTAVVLKMAFLSINGVDLSDWCSKIELTCEVDEKDVTTYGSSGWMEVLGGLAKGQLALQFKQDYLDNQLDEQLWALFGVVTTFEVRPFQTAVGVSNPKWTGSVLVKDLKPIAGAVGDVAEMDVTWPTSGQVTRASA